VVDADCGTHPRREQLQHASGAGAEVHVTLEAALADKVEQRLTDATLEAVAAAHAVPLPGIAIEVAGGAFLVRAVKPCEAGEVVAQLAIVARQIVPHEPHQRMVGKTVEDPGALLVALDDARVAQQLEVPAHPGLALFEDDRQLGYGQLPVEENRDDPEPGSLGDSLQGPQK